MVIIAPKWTGFAMRHLKHMAIATLAVNAVCGAGIAVAQPSAMAPESRYHVEERFAGGRLSFSADSGLSNFTLRVSGPDGYTGQIYSERVVPTFRLADHGSVADGLYYYEITAATPERARRASPQDLAFNGRDPGSSGGGFVGVSYSGSFRVANGRILELDTSLQEG